MKRIEGFEKPLRADGKVGLCDGVNWVMFVARRAKDLEHDVVPPMFDGQYKPGHTGGE